MIQEYKKLKVALPKGEKFILTQGRDRFLYLFSEENWDGYFAELLELAKKSAEAKMFMRYLMRTAVEVEVDEENEIEIPEMLWEYMTLENNESQITMNRAQDMDNLGMAGKYQPWIIGRK